MDTKSDGSGPGGVEGLRLFSVKKSYKGTMVVNDLSLKIEKGELFCLLGPSGCGKTTLLKIVAGLLDHDGGQVSIAGENMTAVPPQERGVGLVFQNYALFPNMSVAENVAYGLRRRRIPADDVKRRVKEMLEFVHMKEYGNRRIHELSGGEQQRVALARALVIHPRVLLLDEPLSNLDARLRADIRNEIRRIQRELHLTTLYVTHDQEEAMSLADRIAIMNKGEIAQIGTPRDIYEKPVNRFVADFIGKMNFFPGKVIDNEVHVMNHKVRIPNHVRPEKKAVVCALRPERLILESPSESLVQGVIKEVIYFGPVVRYHIALNIEEQDQEMISEVPVTHPDFRVGDAVGIKIDDEFIHIFFE